MKKIIIDFFCEKSGQGSGKRFVGIIGALCLFTAMFVFHTSELYYCVTTVVLGALAITGVEKILSK